MKQEKVQNIEEEVKFFNRICLDHQDFDTIAESLYVYLMARIQPFLGNTILDAGCGSGAFGKRLRSSVGKCILYGIDLNSQLVSIAREKNVYDELFCADLSKDNLFAADKFDTIVCPYLLHHFPSLRIVINNFHKWLKPGGFLVIIDPNGSNPILRVSYFLRLVLGKFMDISAYASINEAHKSVRNFTHNLKDFEVKLIESFAHSSQECLCIKPTTIINFFALIQHFLLKSYRMLPFCKYNGSDLLIIVKKNS